MLGVVLMLLVREETVAKEDKNTINKSKTNRQGNVKSDDVLHLSGDNNERKA